MAENYNYSDVMVPMGCDFTYENAGQNYRLMDA